jgi:26S proteasome regulatory subunit N5
MDDVQNFGDGRLDHMEVNYASQVDEALPKADNLAKASNSTMFALFNLPV